MALDRRSKASASPAKDSTSSPGAARAVKILNKLPPIPCLNQKPFSSGEVDRLTKLQLENGQPLFDAGDSDVFYQLVNTCLTLRYGRAIMNNDCPAYEQALQDQQQADQAAQAQATQAQGSNQATQANQAQASQEEEIKEQDYIKDWKYGKYQLGLGFEGLLEYLTQPWLFPQQAVHESPLLDAARELIVIEALNARSRPEVEEGPYYCPKCKSRKQLISQVQRRSADEGMDTNLTCTDCGKKWTIGG